MKTPNKRAICDALREVCLGRDPSRLALERAQSDAVSEEIPSTVPAAAPTTAAALFFSAPPLPAPCNMSARGPAWDRAVLGVVTAAGLAVAAAGALAAGASPPPPPPPTADDELVLDAALPALPRSADDAAALYQSAKAPLASECARAPRRAARRVDRRAGPVLTRSASCSRPPRLWPAPRRAAQRSSASWGTPSSRQLVCAMPPACVRAVLLFLVGSPRNLTASFPPSASHPWPSLSLWYSKRSVSPSGCTQCIATGSLGSWPSSSASPGLLSKASSHPRHSAAQLTRQRHCHAVDKAPVDALASPYLPAETSPHTSAYQCVRRVLWLAAACSTF